jgi:5'(3')-deoxyribonucleotidase
MRSPAGDLILPRVAVDLDGVLANTMAACCRIINARHLTHFEVASFVHWEAWQIANISRDEFFRSLDDAWFHWRTIPPTEEQLAEKVGKLLEFSKVDIVTSRSPETVASARAWLKAERIRFNSFIRTNSGMDKADLDYDVFVDDSPELMSALALKPDSYGILYTQPWNKELPTMPRISRVDSWSQIPERAREILNK